MLAPLPVHINVDLLTQLARVGRRCPGRSVGLRLNPRAGVMRGHKESLYSGTRPTKFGIYEEDLDAALDIATRCHLTIDTAHVHLANNMLTANLPAFDRALGEAARLVDRLVGPAGCPLQEVNVGGGLGTPVLAGEDPLDLDAYAAIIARHFGHLGVAIGAEPGEFLTNEAGLLLAEVITVEPRQGSLFIGLDVGWNVLNHRFIYGRDLVLGYATGPTIPVHSTSPSAATSMRATTYLL